MPSPRYIICAETRITDRMTQLVTFCNVIEGMTFTKSDSMRQTFSDRNLPLMRIMASASWIAEESDFDTKFAYEYLLHKPGHPVPVVCARGQFSFGGKFHRIDQSFVLQPTPDDFHPGIVTVENRIRREDSDDSGEWHSQKFPIAVEVKTITATAHDVVEPRTS